MPFGPRDSRPRSPPSRTDHDAELDAILEGAQKARIVEVYTDDEGQQVMRLTPKGEQVARQLAMTDEDGKGALMGALLEDGD